MKAVRSDRYGDASVLEVRTVDRPHPAAGEVLVEVFTAGINPGEIAIREGRLQDIAPAHFPEGQGSDFAGRVVHVGDGVSDVAVGASVIGISDGRNAQAEYVTIAADRVVPKPDDLQWDVAGTVYVARATAELIVRTLKPQTGETLIVMTYTDEQKHIKTAVLEALDALTCKDVSKWPALFGDDGVQEFPFAPEVSPKRIEGKAAIVEYLIGYPETLDLHRIHAPVWHHDGNTAIAQFAVEGTAVPTGKPYNQSYISAIEHRGGKIIRYVDY